MTHELRTEFPDASESPGLALWRVTHSWQRAIRDALEPFPGPVVEVHISDGDAREDWRRASVLEGLTAGRVVGEGIDGYRRALGVLAERRDG